MAKLGHIAVKLDGMKTKVKDFVTQLYKIVQKPAMFAGFTKAYEPYSQSGERAETVPTETQMVQARAQEVLGQARVAWTELIDLTYQQDVGNTEAKADIAVDGAVLAKDIPITTIMFLIKQFTDAYTMVNALPIPDSAVEWAWDDAQGLLKSVRETVTQKTAKVPKVLVKFDPTDKHPGQSEVYHVDQPVGEYKKREFSGAIKRQTKDEILAKLTKLIAALKEARESANMNTPAKDVKVADALFGFAFQPLDEANSVKSAKAV
jgi:hypothetical protein